MNIGGGGLSRVANQTQSTTRVPSFRRSLFVVGTALCISLIRGAQGEGAPLGTFLPQYQPPEPASQSGNIASAPLTHENLNTLLSERNPVSSVEVNPPLTPASQSGNIVSAPLTHKNLNTLPSEINPVSSEKSDTSSYVSLVEDDTNSSVSSVEDDTSSSVSSVEDDTSSSVSSVEDDTSSSVSSVEDDTSSSVSSVEVNPPPTPASQSGNIASAPLTHENLKTLPSEINPVSSGKSDTSSYVSLVEDDTSSSVSSVEVNPPLTPASQSGNIASAPLTHKNLNTLPRKRNPVSSAKSDTSSSAERENSFNTRPGTPEPTLPSPTNTSTIAPTPTDTPTTGPTTAGPTSSAPTGAPPGSNTNNYYYNSSDSSLAREIGIGAGALVVGLVIGAAVCYCRKKRQNQNATVGSANTPLVQPQNGPPAINRGTPQNDTANVTQTATPVRGTNSSFPGYGSTEYNQNQASSLPNPGGKLAQREAAPTSDALTRAGQNDVGSDGGTSTRSAASIRGVPYSESARKSQLKFNKDFKNLYGTDHRGLFIKSLALKYGERLSEEDISKALSDPDPFYAVSQILSQDLLKAFQTPDAYEAYKADVGDIQDHASESRVGSASPANSPPIMGESTTAPASPQNTERTANPIPAFQAANLGPDDGTAPPGNPIPKNASGDDGHKPPFAITSSSDDDSSSDYPQENPTADPSNPPYGTPSPHRNPAANQRPTEESTAATPNPKSNGSSEPPPPSTEPDRAPPLPLAETAAAAAEEKKAAEARKTLETNENNARTSLETQFKFILKSQNEFTSLKDQALQLTFSTQEKKELEALIKDLTEKLAATTSSSETFLNETNNLISNDLTKLHGLVSNAQKRKAIYVDRDATLTPTEKQAILSQFLSNSYYFEAVLSHGVFNPRKITGPNQKISEIPTLNKYKHFRLVVSNLEYNDSKTICPPGTIYVVCQEDFDSKGSPPITIPIALNIPEDQAQKFTETLEQLFTGQYKNKSSAEKARFFFSAINEFLPAILNVLDENNGSVFAKVKKIEEAPSRSNNVPPKATSPLRAKPPTKMTLGRTPKK